MNILKMFDGSQRFLRKNKSIVDSVLEYSENFSSLSDADLKAKTKEFINRYENGETLEDILPEAFAVCREASWRVLNMKHFPVQIYGGIVLHQSDIAEMKTGEGKTLVVTLPAYLNALTGKSVHIVTVNEYLAKRDKEQMGRVFDFLGLKTGLIYSSQPFEDKKAAYACNIVYGTNSEFGFDYLRDHMISDPTKTVQGELYYAIIDEVDSILIDEARTPLIITSPKTKPTEYYKLANELVESLTSEDYDFNEKDRVVSLSESGVAKAEKFFGIDNLSDLGNITINHYVNTALKAHFLTKRDIDYIIKNNEIILIDHFTGRLAFGKQYNDGIHQAIQAKERLEICPENAVDATITYQNYFRLYKKISGMTGTAKTEEDEFFQIYRLNVIEIPTNKPVLRIDHPDVVYKTIDAKYKAIITDIKARYEKGQPVLVGTPNIEKSEVISELLAKEGIPHHVLNAKFHEKEAYLVAQAGRFKAITIATNMAGRGTDILLGGNNEFLAKDMFFEKHGFEYSTLDTLEIDNDTKKFYKNDFILMLDKATKQVANERKAVIAAGGLYVVGTERHEARRIDNQLRGRAGRQGDPGESRFYLSLEDELLRLFGGERVQNIAETLGLDDETPISAGFLSNIVENSQKKLESIHYASRKTLIQYDDVINIQRNMIYKDRNIVLNSSAKDLYEQVRKMIESEVDKIVVTFLATSEYPEKLDIADLNKLLFPLFNFEVAPKNPDYTSPGFVQELKTLSLYRFDQIISVMDEPTLCEFLKYFILNTVDEFWKEHIDAVNELKKGIGFRGYAQHDPVTEYKFETYEMYKEMIAGISYNTVKGIFHAVINVKQEDEQASIK